MRRKELWAILIVVTTVAAVLVYAAVRVIIEVLKFR